MSLLNIWRVRRALSDFVLPACPVNPAFGSDKVTIDFTKGESDVFTSSTGGTPVTYDPVNGAVFSIAKEGDSPTFTSTKYMFFGRVDVTMRVAPGAGIVSTFVLESDVLDEVDWEWLGGNSAVGQANYFSKGDTSTYGKLEQDITIADTENTFHTYSLVWTPESIQWMVDGTSYRTLTYASNPSQFPQTPMMVKFGIWCGGCSAQQGTSEWAGGPPNWAAAPFNAYYKSIVIQDDSNGVADAVSYQYGDQTGNYKSIIVNTGSGTTTTGNTGTTSSGSDSGDDSSSAAASSATTATSLTANDRTESPSSTTLSTVTAPGSSGSPVTSSGSQATPVSGSNGTATTGGSGASKTGSGTATETTPVQAGAQKAAVNLAFLGAVLFALASL